MLSYQFVSHPQPRLIQTQQSELSLRIYTPKPVQSALPSLSGIITWGLTNE